MNVKWAYEGISFQHTLSETDDVTAHSWTRIDPIELIYHAANLHLFRAGDDLADAGRGPVDLWLSPGKAPPERRIGRPIL